MYCFFISIFAISIVLLPNGFNMKRIQVLLLFIVISCSMFAQDRLSLFIGRANKYAAVELSDYRKRLCVEYNISNQLLDDYYRRCGSNWGNVGLALEIAKTSGRHMREVCDYYKRYHRNGWNRILVEIGIKPGSMYYDPFYDRIRYHSECWREHYCSYCDHHDKHHRKHYKKHKRHKHHKWHDDDDDWDDDDGGNHNEFRIGVNLGAGAEFALGRNWAMNVEFRYQLVDDFDQGVINFGAAYRF